MEEGPYSKGQSFQRSFGKTGVHSRTAETAFLQRNYSWGLSRSRLGATATATKQDNHCEVRDMTSHHEIGRSGSHNDLKLKCMALGPNVRQGPGRVATRRALNYSRQVVSVHSNTHVPIIVLHFHTASTVDLYRIGIKTRHNHWLLSKLVVGVAICIIGACALKLTARTAD